MERALSQAKAKGARTILDPAPARQLSPELLHNVDFLTPSENEALMLLGKPPTPVDDDAQAEAVADELLALGPGTVVLKLGPRSCLLTTQEGHQWVSGFEVAALDTTAAGDTFNGAFATALSEGRPVIEAARFANAAGALSVTKPGAQSSIPSREEVDEFLRGSNPGTVRWPARLTNCTPADIYKLLPRAVTTVMEGRIGGSPTTVPTLHRKIRVSFYRRAG